MKLRSWPSFGIVVVRGPRYLSEVRRHGCSMSEAVAPPQSEHAGFAGHARAVTACNGHPVIGQSLTGGLQRVVIAGRRGLAPVRRLRARSAQMAREPVYLTCPVRWCDSRGVTLTCGGLALCCQTCVLLWSVLEYIRVVFASLWFLIAEFRLH